MSLLVKYHVFVLHWHNCLRHICAGILFFLYALEFHWRWCFVMRITNFSMVHYLCWNATRIVVVLCVTCVCLWCTSSVIYALVCGQTCCVVMCSTMFVKFRHRDGYRRNWNYDRFETHNVTSLIVVDYLDQHRLTSAVLLFSDCVVVCVCEIVNVCAKVWKRDGSFCQQCCLYSGKHFSF